MNADTHVAWETLGDFADSALDEDEALLVLSHVASCATCRATLDGVQRLRDEAARLPTAVAAPPSLWREIAASIVADGSRRDDVRRHGGAPGVVGTIGGGADAVADGTATATSAGRTRAASPAAASPAVASPAAASTRATSRRHLRAPRLAAAAVLLVALSSGLTAVVLRGTGAVETTAAPASAPSVAAGGMGGDVTLERPLSGSFAATEVSYLGNVAELQALYVSQRAALSPATIAVVERALAAIDAAITEVRAALLRDPANRAITDLLEGSYRQKVDLLRRAAEFPHSL